MRVLGPQGDLMLLDFSPSGLSPQLTTPWLPAVAGRASVNNCA